MNYKMNHLYLSRKMMVDFSLSAVIFPIANFHKRKFFWGTLYKYISFNLFGARIGLKISWKSLSFLYRRGIIGFPKAPDTLMGEQKDAGLLLVETSNDRIDKEKCRRTSKKCICLWMEPSIPCKLSQVEELTTFAIKDNNTRHQSGLVSLILSKQYNNGECFSSLKRG